MRAIRIRYPSVSPPLSYLVETRDFFGQSVAALKRKAAAREVILDIPVFSGDWQENRTRLPALLKWVSGSTPLLEVREIGSDGKEGEALVPESLARLMRHLRKIELEQQMAIDLEEGFIQRPEDFHAHDKEWTEPGASTHPDAPPSVT